MARVDYTDRRGPFDIIGDVHGCFDELVELLDALGYEASSTGARRSSSGRTAVFVGDLVDRGPRSVDTLRLVMRMVADGGALCVPGNHDLQLEHYLAGLPTPLVYGLETTVAELEGEGQTFRDDLLVFLQELPSHVLLDDGRLVVAHTGLAEEWHGQDTDSIRLMAAYGVTSGEVDPDDIGRRHAWLDGYRGSAAMVYGHTVVSDAEWHGRTIDIDTGCVFGGRLTALRWPEQLLLSVAARHVYAAVAQSFAAKA